MNSHEVEKGANLSGLFCFVIGGSVTALLLFVLEHFFFH